MCDELNAVAAAKPAANWEAAQEDWKLKLLASGTTEALVWSDACCCVGMTNGTFVTVDEATSTLLL